MDIVFFVNKQKLWKIGGTRECNRGTNNRGIPIDGALTQFGPEVIGRVCLHNNVMGCHFMLD